MSDRDLALTADEQELALAETTAVLDAAVGPDYREQLLALTQAIGAGVLAPKHAATLERILELALQAGRIRAVYGPPGEHVALSLFRRLPGGAALTASAHEVSSALGALEGRTLQGATLTAVGPGSYTLSLATDEARISVRLDRQGARLASVEV